MVRKGYAAALLFSLVFGFTANAQKVTVAAAANVQFALNELKTDFQKETGIEVDVVLGSSGNLAAQIEQSAPFDVFVSADTRYPKELFTKGFTTDSPKIYAQGLLVLWSMKPGIKLTGDLKILTDDSVLKIAIANPQTAPYGAAAVEAIKYFKVYDIVKNKLVFGESISQTNQYITSGAATAGFTAKSIVLADEMKGKGSWVDVDPKSYSPIAQAAVLLKHSQDTNAAAALKFYNYLFSPEAKAIFKKYGYIVN